MTTTRAAKYLNGADTGKTITVANIGTATISTIEHGAEYTRVRLHPRMTNGTHTLILRHDVEVALDGHMKPANTKPQEQA